MSLYTIVNSSDSSGAKYIMSFEPLIAALAHEAELRDIIRDKVKEMETLARRLTASLTEAHATASDEACLCSLTFPFSAEKRLAAESSCSTTTNNVLKQNGIVQRVGHGIIEGLKGEGAIQLMGLKELIPAALYYKYIGQCHHVLSQWIYLLAIAFFFTKRTLVTADDVGDILQLPVNEPTMFHITVENFLHGIASVPSELTRLSVNAVPNSHFRLSLQIAAFVSALHRDFSLLNLRNDKLRQRFDAIKYDVKRCEEIVFELTLRKLV